MEMSKHREKSGTMLGRRTLGLIAMIAALCGCSAVHEAASSFQKSYAAGFHKSFRASFKVSFMASCTRGGAGEKLCNCIETTLERKNTDDQLMEMSKHPEETRMALADAARACASGS